MNSNYLQKQRSLKNLIIHFLFLTLIALSKCQPDNPEESDTAICGGFLKFADDYPELKTIVIDTYDFFIDLAEAESLRLYNKQSTIRDRVEERESQG